MSRCICEGVFTLIVNTTSFGGDVKPSVPGCWLVLALSCLVAKWLKCWTADQEVPGSGPTGNRDFFLFRVYSALTSPDGLQSTSVLEIFWGHMLLNPTDVSALSMPLAHSE